MRGGTGENGVGPSAGRRLPGFLAFVLALAVYLANGREIGTYDTEPTTLLVQAVLDGDGLVLDRFAPLLVPKGGEVPDFLTQSRSHLVSRYPVAPALLAVPLVVPQRWWLDSTKRGWRSIAAGEFLRSHGMAKNASAVLAALAVGLLPGLLRQLGLSRLGWVTVLAFAFGSPVWVIGSQALWQHGPAVLLFVIALRSLAVPEPGRARLVLGGLAAGGMVACRLFDLIFAGAILAWVARCQTRRLTWFLAGFVPVVAAVAVFNIAWFGTPLGGLAELELLHPKLHAVSGPWTWNLGPGLLGTLLSPSRGLFVFVPWVLVTLALLPVTWSRLRALPMIPWVVLALVPYTIALAGYSVWWGGFCYGPRYWTDAMPLFAILLAAALSETPGRLAWVRIPLALGVVTAVALQALGAWCYPSSWNLLPANVDTHHERLWDWRDSEVTRCMREKLLAPAPAPSTRSGR